ncbi:MAG: NYN domain-containing protein [Rickettsiales bacterium]|jgi:uncharacterized LabA/DUF88 family protein|nr:NYN domain-containing protein [Rickettsiales bacterium]
MIKKVGIYVDGFNLFFGALKLAERKKYRWLNIQKLVQEACKSYLSKNDYEVRCIKFCTARISKRADNDDSPRKQQIYFNALKTIPNLHLIFGNFLVHKKFAAVYPIELDSRGRAKTRLVVHTEEKGSDVNLAAHLLADAFRGDIDIAIMITNDTDLVTPLKIASEELRKEVLVVSPFRKTAYSIKQLRRVKCYNIETSHLAAAQFPNEITTGAGRVITKPKDW